MEYGHYYLILKHPPASANLLTLPEAARQARVRPELLERLMDLGLIEAELTSPELLFAPEVVADVGRALRLRHDLGINWVGVGLVMDLLERVGQLERELAHLRNR
ncbi:MAG: MerR family transcriptional regulator [Firmicutes bacterium]|nr:MerR family transcriptional regulator [Bacillota bacterium]